MEAFDQLDLVAEISATLLGFIAVFLVLSKEDGRFLGSDRHFVQSLVMTAAFAIVVAIAPRAFRQFLVEAMAWQSATILAIALGALSMYLQARHQQEMSADESSRIHWLWHLVAWGLASSCAALFVLGLFDSARVTAYYVTSVSLLVPLNLLVFIAIVFRRFF